MIERFGADALRFYLFREVSFGQDGSISTAGFEQRYETELPNDYGNLASRVLVWSLATRFSAAGRQLHRERIVRRLTPQLEDAGQWGTLFR